MPPIMTVPGRPPTGTLPTTGDGGRPPPRNTPERSAPHSPSVLTAPEAVSRFTALPRASPRLAPHCPGAGGTGRLVLKKIRPPKIAAEVTVCSPRPVLRSMNQPLRLLPRVVAHVVLLVKFAIVPPSRSTGTPEVENVSTNM